MKPRKKNGLLKIKPKVFEKKYKEKKFHFEKTKIYEKTKSVLKSIRNKCLWCCGDSPSEVAMCPHGGDCSEFGHIKSRSPKCKQCKEENAELYMNCRNFALEKLFICPLWAFRFGKNPYTKKNLTDEQRQIISERMKKYQQSKKEEQNG